MGGAGDAVYGKSEQGRAELASRTRRLTGPLRTALILVDGRTDATTLCGKLGPDALRLFDELLRDGYIERVQPVRPRPETPRAEPSVPAPVASPHDEGLAALRRIAVRVLAPHFGPDVLEIARPLYDAPDRAAFTKALDGIERRLAVYIGRSAATSLLEPLRR